MAEVETVKVKVEADTSNAKESLAELEKISKGFGQALTKSITDIVVKGKGLDTVFKELALSLSKVALKAGLAPLEGIISGATQSLLSSLTGFGAKANTPTGSTNIQPFAKGGVISAPTFFPLGRGTGLAGEAGAEAIMPLKRGSDGRLGVATNSSGGGSPVVVNIQTQNIESFRRSEAQISTAIARAVGRARRSN